jgi:hypothetical protein
MCSLRTAFVKKLLHYAYLFWYEIWRGRGGGGGGSKKGPTSGGQPPGANLEGPTSRRRRCRWGWRRGVLSAVVPVSRLVMVGIQSRCELAALSSGMASEPVLAPFWSAAAVSWGQNEVQNYLKSNERCAPYFLEQEGSQHDSKLCFEIMCSKYVSKLCFEMMV